jgi:hypothetical protein
MPRSEQDFVELNGLRILPLADGSLGLLQLDANWSTCYYLADKSELRLFDFAWGLLTGKDPGKSFKQAILGHKTANLRKLRLSDVGKLLERKKFESKSPSEKGDAWLENFWKYWRQMEPECKPRKTFMEDIGIQHYSIFAATCNGVRTYMDPAKLEILPSVIESEDEPERALCLKIPGIYIFKREFLPTYLEAAERSLAYKDSFSRFIRALSNLASKGGLPLDVYIMNHLDPLDIMV